MPFPPFCTAECPRSDSAKEHTPSPKPILTVAGAPVTQVMLKVTTVSLKALSPSTGRGIAREALTRTQRANQNRRFLLALGSDILVKTPSSLRRFMTSLSLNQILQLDTRWVWLEASSP